VPQCLTAGDATAYHLQVDCLLLESVPSHTLGPLVWDASFTLCLTEETMIIELVYFCQKCSNFTILTVLTIHETDGMDFAFNFITKTIPHQPVAKDVTLAIHSAEDPLLLLFLVPVHLNFSVYFADFLYRFLRSR